MKKGEYFLIISSSGKELGIFKNLTEHTIGEVLTYRSARWYERLWIQKQTLKVLLWSESQ